MKVLKYLLYIILALILFALIMGLLKPTIEYGHEITADKPVEEAWAVSQDVAKFADWLKGFKSIELIEGKQDEIGSKYKVIVNPGEGQDDFEMIQTLVDYKEFDYATLHFDSEVMTFDQTINYKEADGKTTITSDSKVAAKGMMMRSMFAVMDLLSGSFQKQEAENFENLKKLIDENTTDYFPAPEEEVIMEEEVGDN